MPKPALEVSSPIHMQSLLLWIRHAGKIALAGQAHNHLTYKEDGSPVTSVDREIESYLVKQIVHHYPGHQVICEEGTNISGNDFLWIVDPIDGTRAYAAQLPVWGISVGVFFQGQPLAGAFYMPMTGEMVWGNNGKAFYNNRPITHVHQDSHGKLSFLAVPSSAHLHYKITFPRLRSLGSTAAHLSYVARGAAFGALTRNLLIWDLAGILPAIQAADVQMVYLSGKPFNLADVLGGDPSPEPLVVANSNALPLILSSITPIPPDPM